MKGNIKKMRRQATDWEKLFAKDISNKGGLSKIYKELLKFNNNRANNLIKKWTKDFNLIKRDTEMAN